MRSLIPALLTALTSAECTLSASGVTGPTVAEFNARHNDKCVNQWYRASGRRPGQMKRKAYKKRETGKKARTEFRVEEFLA